MANEFLARDVLVLAYKAFDGDMRGKTLLQKRVYFLSVMLGVEMGYDAHYYGPYSGNVATLNSELKSLGYVSESSSAVTTQVRNPAGLRPEGNRRLGLALSAA